MATAGETSFTPEMVCEGILRVGMGGDFWSHAGDACVRRAFHAHSAGVIFIFILF